MYLTIYNKHKGIDFHSFSVTSYIVLKEVIT